MKAYYLFYRYRKHDALEKLVRYYPLPYGRGLESGLLTQHHYWQKSDCGNE